MLLAQFQVPLGTPSTIDRQFDRAGERRGAVVREGDEGVGVVVDREEGRDRRVPAALVVADDARGPAGRDVQAEVGAPGRRLRRRRGGRCRGRVGGGAGEALGGDTDRVAGAVVDDRGVGDEGGAWGGGADDGVAVGDGGGGGALEDLVDLLVLVGPQGVVHRAELDAVGAVEVGDDGDGGGAGVDVAEVGPVVELGVGVAVGELDEAALLAGGDGLVGGEAGDELAEGGAGGEVHGVAAAEGVVGPAGDEDGAGGRGDAEGGGAVEVEDGVDDVGVAGGAAGFEGERLGEGRGVVGVALEQGDGVAGHGRARVVDLEVGAPVGAQRPRRVRPGGNRVERRRRRQRPCRVKS